MTKQKRSPSHINFIYKTIRRNAQVYDHEIDFTFQSPIVDWNHVRLVSVSTTTEWKKKRIYTHARHYIAEYWICVPLRLWRDIYVCICTVHGVLCWHVKCSLLNRSIESDRVEFSHRVLTFIPLTLQHCIKQYTYTHKHTHTHTIMLYVCSILFCFPLRRMTKASTKLITVEIPEHGFIQSRNMCASTASRTAQWNIFENFLHLSSGIGSKLRRGYESFPRTDGRMCNVRRFVASGWQPTSIVLHTDKFVWNHVGHAAERGKRTEQKYRWLTLERKALF